MIYAYAPNGTVEEYPLYEGDIRLRFSNVSFATPFVPPEGYEVVQPSEAPAGDDTHEVLEGMPVRQGGVLIQSWDVRECTPEEVKIKQDFRTNTNTNVRNAKLAMTDWTQLSDVDLTADCKAAFAAYRKELRSIDLLNPVWPTAPEEQWSE